MGGSTFDLITQKLLNQKHIMELMEEENRQLRQQIADLRAGHGIFMEINGQRIELQRFSSPSAPMPTQPEQQSTITDTTTMQPEQSITGALQVKQASGELPVEPVAEATPEVENQPTKQQGFLEEMMLDEFESALTSPLHVHQDQQQPEENGQAKQSSSTETAQEEQHAALRRELMGSFLLE
ncbi:MAG TPA: hypothetical protein VL461_04320 [Dictyobacter sp.]|jgi:hypothetical protein|nr:hypothetical protein [Dictyobacter sp.]